MVPLARALRTMLELPEFRAQTRVRFSFLEGQARYDLRFTTEDDRLLRDASYTEVPFVASLTVRGPELQLSVHHREVEISNVSAEKMGIPFSVSALGSGVLQRLDFAENESLSVETSSGTFSRAAGGCVSTVELATPEDHLRSILEARGR